MCIICNMYKNVKSFDSFFGLKFLAIFSLMSNKAGNGYLVSPVEVDHGINLLHVYIHRFLFTGGARLYEQLIM